MCLRSVKKLATLDNVYVVVFNKNEIVAAASR